VGFFEPLIFGVLSSGLGQVGRARAGSDAAAARIAFENFKAGIAPDREHDLRMARTRWLERHDAVASFTCGLAAMPADVNPEPDPWGERKVEPVPVTVAVLPSEFVFLREGIADQDDELIVEMGRFPRDALLELSLLDVGGQPVVAPAGDVFEPPATCELVVRWRTADGGADDDTFVFRSISVADEAAQRFRRNSIWV